MSGSAGRHTTTHAVPPVDDVEHHETIIVGAGPGGLQLAHLMMDAGRDVLVLEREEDSGGSFRHLPVFRKLISINKVGVDGDQTSSWRWGRGTVMLSIASPGQGVHRWST